MFRVGIILVVSLICNMVHAATTTFIAVGDAPYFGKESQQMFRQFVDQVNSKSIDFLVHIGDIRGGDSDCSNQTFEKVYNLFQAIEAPVIYTPGDNEWTDCHAKKSGPNDPLERLAYVRKKFFPKNKSLGRQKLILESQASDPTYSDFVENRRFFKDDVAYVTVHIVGSNNNYKPDNKLAMREFTLRNSANLAWLDSSFRLAQQKNAKAMVLMFHANPMLDIETGRLTEEQMTKLNEDRKGFKDFSEKLREITKAFGKPILAIHGDFHTYRINKPLMEETPWGFEWPIENFTRLEVFGAPDVRGVLVRVDTNLEEPFIVTPLPAIPWLYPLPEKVEADGLDI